MRTGAGVFDVSHMGEIETSGPRRRGVPPAHPLQRRHEDRRARRPVLACSASEDGGVLDDLFTYRLDDDRFLTVTNAANHEQGPGLVPGAGRRASTSRSRDAARRLRDARRSRARTRARILASTCRRRGAARGCAPPTLTRRRRRLPRLRHRLHGRGRRRAADPAGRRRRRSGTRWSPTASPPPASARATRCASRSASTSTATTSPRTATRSRPASAGLQARHGLHRLRRAARTSSPTQTLVPFAFTGPGIPRQGNPVLVDGGRRARSRAARCRPASRSASAWRTFPSRAAEPGTPIEVDVRGKLRPAEVRKKPLYEEGELSGRRELPRGPEVPPRARLGPDRGRQRHVRHHLVRAGPARRGRVLRPARGRRRRCRKDAAYAEVESVKAVSDVFAPLSGEVTEVNEALEDTPEKINDDPYGEGWLVKVKLSDPSRGRLAARRGRVQGAASRS